jgi:hypothetical protein
MPLVIIAGIAAVALAAALLQAVRRVPTGPDGTGVPDTMRPIVRRSAVLRLAGFGVGLAAAAAISTTAPPNWLGLEAALAAPAFTLCLLAGVLIGELSSSVPTGPDRAAPIEVRSVRSYLPRFMTGAVIAIGGALAVLLTVTSRMGDADDMGRSGRSLTLSCGDLTASSGPWPGVYYTLPIAASVLIGIAVAVPTLHAVTRRRRPATDDAVRTADDDARRASARTIIAACGVLVAMPLTGTGLFAGVVMVSHSCATTAVTALGWTAIVLCLTAFIATCWFTAVAVTPYQKARR